MATADAITELQEAIFNYLWIQTNSFKTACVGGLHYDEIPENEKNQLYPCGFYFFVSVVFDRGSCSKYVDAIIQFDFKDKAIDSNQNKVSSKRLNGVMAEFDARFNDCEQSLSMTNFTAISVDNINQQAKPARKSIANRWEGSRTFRIQLDRK